MSAATASPKAAEVPRLVGDTPYTKKINALVVAARINFGAFILLMHPAESGYVLGPLHKYLARTVQGMVDGTEAKRMAISVPPQHGKSSLLTVLAAAWLVGRYPGIAIGLTGALGSLLNDFSKRVRSLVNSPQYQWAFPGVVPVFGSNRSDSWRLSNDSSIVARPAGSKLTGRRVDFLIIDDPHKGREDAESPLMRARVREWYFADCYTRLSPSAKVLIVATRWHPEDLIGHLTGDTYAEEMTLMEQKAEIYSKIVIEALCEHPEDDPLGRELGEPLCPELGRGREFLLATRAALPAYEWASQYQGNPKQQMGDTIDPALFKRIKANDLPDDITWLRGWDFALTENQTADFTAGPMCGLREATGEFYIAECAHDKKAWARLKPWVIQISLRDIDTWGARRMAVEVVGAFDIAAVELRNELIGEVKVVKITSSKSKIVRAQPWVNKLEAGKCYLVEGAWNKAFCEELQAFPTGKHDDRVDGVSVAYAALTKKPLLVA